MGRRMGAGRACAGALPELSCAAVWCAREEPPVVPAIDAAMQARLRAVFRAGRAAGNRADVLSKVGDSVTASMSFLAAPFGCPECTSAGAGGPAGSPRRISFIARPPHGC